MVMLADGTAHTTEPDADGPDHRDVSEPDGRAQVPGLAVERAAAEHPPAAPWRSVWIARAGRPVVPILQRSRQRSQHHSQTLPDMSNRPQGLGDFSATEWGSPFELSLKLDYASAAAP